MKIITDPFLYFIYWPYAESLSFDTDILVTNLITLLIDF